MRRLSPRVKVAGAAAAGAVIGCASMQAPPGGPEDRDPAQVLRVVPESGAVRFNRRVVEFHFDEVISDRGTGAAALGQLVLISPRDEAPRVAYRRDAVAARPRSGWRPNTTYTVTLLPGVTDLRGNTTRMARTTVFSTGDSIAAFLLRGRVFDWMAERPAAGGWIEAVSRPDSVVHVAISDSAGLFTVGPLASGMYWVRAFADQNNNRALDRSEAWDSVTVRTPPPGVATSVELLLALRDTIPPRIAGVSPIDSVTLSVEFDRPLDVAQPITPALFSVQRADSAMVPVREASSRRDFDARESARRQPGDTTRADTAQADTARARGRPIQQPGQQPTVVRPGADVTARPSRPPPVTQVVLRVGARLEPGTSYRVTARDVRNLVGRAGTTSRVVQIPRPAAADTTRLQPPR